MSTTNLKAMLSAGSCSSAGDECVRCLAEAELSSLVDDLLDLREVAFDGPSEVKGAPGGESYWDWRERIRTRTEKWSSIPKRNVDKEKQP